MEELNFEKFKDTCKETGLKLTHQRYEIYRELAATNDHPSAEELHKRVQKRVPAIALDTVYRTLSTFVEFGLAAKVQVAEDHARFDANVEPHHHCICTRCRQIVDFKWELFDYTEPPGAPSQWGDILSKHVVLVGVCRECLKKG